ncbi:TetR/AcrR family transcriptional regulator [Granulicella sibirica]|uniref:TetR/AcrR family transcriptional regulator n=1 Tax=Granulicella sibirica TaxID=2479048 RepID=UPI001F4F685A|nr:TetR/AcrR family transcriptional regulator [Granulicella sibirica]
MQYNLAMAWDTDETQRRLREAASAEFSAKGPDGTTMAGIAERAGINKERLYNYFGDKQSLFEMVLVDELEKLAVSMLNKSPGFEDLGEYAGCLFDYHASNPALLRLLLWEGLAGRSPVNEAGRTVHYQRAVEKMAAAQRDGFVDKGHDPAKLLFLLIALAAWWSAVPQLARMITGSGGKDRDERRRRRACVVNAARLLASPQSDERDKPSKSRTTTGR